MKSEEFCITGIGASSGGTEALEKFFRNIPSDPGTAFVIIQHLNPDYYNFSKDILNNFTSLPIIYVTKATKPKINHIYLMPSTHNLYFEDGQIVPYKREKEKGGNYPIDIFFYSMAKEYKEKAIGIIFSGLGTDGSQGILTVKEQGGVVMIQSPESAAYKGMIYNAISSDHPDYIADPGKLAEKLLSYIKNPSIFGESVQDLEEKDVVNKIVRQVSEFSRVNFGVYKVPTVARRIEKRIKINQLNTIVIIR